MKKDISILTSIKQLSSKTLAKIIKRSGIGCAICGWTEAALDIHHIVDVGIGGSDEMDNLIAVCPNHHRVIHNKRHIEQKYSNDELKKLSLEYSLVDWQSLYDPSQTRSSHEKKIKEKCKREECSNVTQGKNLLYCCMNCFLLDSKLDKYGVDHIVKLLTENNFNLSKTSKILGFSDNAIRKFCKKHNIQINKTKYKRNTKTLRV